MTAVQLTPQVWLVGGSEGPARTDSYDGNQYLVFDGCRGVLVDAGTGRGRDTWLRNVVDVVDDLTRIDALLLTHYHADHAGGAHAAAQHGIPVRASQPTVRAIRAADETTTQVIRAREAGVYPADYRLVPAPTASVITGDPLVVGSLRIRAVDAPGHCDGHLVFALQHDDGEALFTGDALFPGGRVSIQAIPDCRLDVYGDTLQALDQLRVRALYPGHGPSELRREEASEAVRSAAASFRRLVPPPNLLG